MNQEQDSPQKKQGIIALTLCAIGVVYGDIGTSPLYALRECFAGGHNIAAVHDNILGILSLIFWSIIFIISIKYMIFFMRADNRGEGGILALMALVLHGGKHSARWKSAIFIIGIFGAALLYGDGIITPAISVLSAVEGLNVTTNFFEPYIVHISIAVLTLLFALQRRGTAKIGALFGPVLVLWFIVIGLLGLLSICREPAVLKAVNPYYSIAFFISNKWNAFAILGTVFLAITGGEVLYADMGHFGKKPIRTGWFYLVLPALLLNYFGQGAFLIDNPATAENLFYRLAPSWFLYPLVILATFATIIASQAVISGAFSLTRQAIQLGLSPRLHIIHTSSQAIGQVYIPAINFALFIGTVALILGFKNSGSLAGAYGVAVSATMLITTILAAFIARKLWAVNNYLLFPVFILFIMANLAFFLSSLLKIHAGGWIPVLIATIIFTLLITWRNGREFLRKKIESQSLNTEIFLKDIQSSKPTRVSGTAVFLTANDSGIPRTLLHNFKHNKVLHHTTVLMTVRTSDIPYVSAEDRSEITELGNGIYRLMLHYGFSEDPNIPKTLKHINHANLNFDPLKTTFFLGRETLVITPCPAFQKWSKKIFAFMSKNSYDASTFYRIPPGRVIELGLQVEL